MLNQEELQRLKDIHQMTIFHKKEIIELFKNDLNLSDEDFLKLFSVKKVFRNNK